MNNIELHKYKEALFKSEITLKKIDAIVVSGSHPTKMSESLTKIELDTSIKKLEEKNIKYDMLNSNFEKQAVNIYTIN